MRYSYPHTEKLLNSFAQTIVSLYRDKIKQYSNGTLYRTLNYRITNGPDDFSVTINLEDYWKYIENGRRPGAKMPPVSAIEKWIEVRRILPKPMTLKSGKQVVPSVKSLAYVIARSIGKKGIKPRPFMSKSIEEATELFKDKLMVSLREDVIEHSQSTNLL